MTVSDRARQDGQDTVSRFGSARYRCCGGLGSKDFAFDVDFRSLRIGQLHDSWPAAEVLCVGAVPPSNPQGVAAAGHVFMVALGIEPHPEGAVAAFAADSDIFA